MNVKNLDLDLGGLEIEFYEPPPVIVQTNIIPRLMQRSKK
jgi:hypothetical protein